MATPFSCAVEATTDLGRFLGTIHVDDQHVTFLPMLRLEPDRGTLAIAGAGLGLVLVAVIKAVIFWRQGVPYFSSLGVTTLAPILGPALLIVAALQRRRYAATRAAAYEMAAVPDEGGMPLEARYAATPGAVRLERRRLLALTGSGSALVLETDLGDRLPLSVLASADGLRRALGAG